MENETEARELLRAYGDASAPAPARKDAAWAALSGRVGAPDGKAPATSGASWLAKAASAIAVLGALAGAVSLGLGDRAADDAAMDSAATPATSRASSSTAVAPPTVTAASLLVPATAVEPDAAPVLERRNVQTRPSRPAVTPAADSQPVPPPPVETSTSVLAPVVTGTLAEELAILRGAQRALRDEDAASALRGLDDHLARFPDGALARDRDIARVAALCALDRDAEATSLAAALDASGTTPAVGRALSRCVADP